MITTPRHHPTLHPTCLMCQSVTTDPSKLWIVAFSQNTKETSFQPIKVIALDRASRDRSRLFITMSPFITVLSWRI